MWRWAIPTMLAFSLLASCKDAEEPVRARAGGPRLVVLFSVCTLGPDLLAPYATGATGAPVAYTPSLARLAERGVVFERHRSEAGQSGVAFASIYSGVQADKHGVYTHPQSLPDDLVLLAEVFENSGWETWYWHGHKMAAPDLNYAQGVPPEHRVRFRSDSLTASDPRFTELLERLGEDPRAHAFLQVNFTYTHGPYHVGRDPEAFERFRSRFPDETPFTHTALEQILATYDEHRLQLQWNFPETVERLELGEPELAELAAAIELAYKVGIHELDLHLGRFLETLRAHGLEDEALIAFTADHGETLYRPETLFKWTHGFQLAPEVLGVPWIVSAPGLLAPGRFEGVTRSIDVYPTLVGLAGARAAPPGSIDGIDLSPALLGTGPAPEAIAWSHTSLINPSGEGRARSWTLFRALFPGSGPETMWVAARSGDEVFKLRRGLDRVWRAECFDLSIDPYEACDLFDEALPSHVAMRRRLELYRERLIEAYARFQSEPVDRGPTLTEREALERLEQMGYVGGEE